MQLIRDPLEPPESTATALPQDKLSLLRHLAKSSPETLALANDWEDTAARVVREQEKLQKYVLCLTNITWHSYKLGSRLSNRTLWHLGWYICTIVSLFDVVLLANMLNIAQRLL